MIDSTMRMAEARRYAVPDTKAGQHHMQSPYGLHNLDGLFLTPPDNDPWHFVRDWMIVGPFPLGWDQFRREIMPVGFMEVYGPETNSDPGATFESVDGPAGWKYAGTDLAGKLDLLDHFTTTDDVVGYARCTVAAPRDMNATFSLGSNDGARVWINGELLYSDEGVRTARPHVYEIEAQLNEGANSVLIKVENTVVNWQLYFSVRDPERELRFEAR